MSSSPATTTVGTSEKSYFEQQRAHLLNEISLAMEHVLMNMNTLNRNFESIIAVGREFEAVEALWTQFEGVMGKQPGKDGEEQEEEEEEGNEEGDETMQG